MADDGTFQVRLATAADAAALADLADLLDQPMHAERFAHDIAAYAKGFLIAELDSKVVGYLVLRKQYAPKDLHVHAPCQLWRIYVAPSWQGKGIAAGLMEQAVTSAREWGFDSIWLGTGEDNIRAIEFYKKHGFKPLGLAQLHAGHDEHQDLIMMWEAD